MSKPENLTAFPVPHLFRRAGMTLRDYFAGQAISACLTNSLGGEDLLEIARDAYKLADVMLTERAKYE